MSHRRTGARSRSRRLWSPRYSRPLQLQENKRHARQARRGAVYLLQGLLQCQHCGSAFSGKRLSPSARTGKPRADASYRCLGTAAYRFGGARLCQNTQVRTELLDLAVWQDVCTWLAHPERLAEEYRRRLQPETRTKRTPLSPVAGQISKLRQGGARLSDSDAEGLIDQGEFEPRVTRLRQRLARVEAQRPALADEAAVHGDLRLIIGRLEDFAAQLHDGLEAADWTRKRDLLRALVKRVEVAREDGNIVFRIDPYPSDTDPEKQSLQLCRGSDIPHIGKHLPSRTRLLHCQDQYDPNFRRLHYCRYADDFVLAAICPKSEAEEIYRTLVIFLKDQLKLNVSQQKSGLKHSTEAIRFLGYDITIRHSDRIVKGIVNGQHFKKRSIAALIRLNIPETKLKSFADRLGYGHWETLEATSRPALSHLSDAEITLHYSAEMRGIAQYYALANNFAILGKLRILWIRSYLKTMANK
jgi:hypothetical protein